VLGEERAVEGVALLFERVGGRVEEFRVSAHSGPSGGGLLSQRIVYFL
jgi:hypothetical protein